MEFKDLATKFEGLTADQVGVLAEFGKDILDDAGIFGLPSCLLGLIQDILNIDEFDIEENRFTIRSLLHIVKNGKRIYPKNSRFFSFLIDDKKLA